MHPSQKQDLQQQLTALGRRIDESIEAIETKAVQMNINAAKMMTMDGHHMLSPLILAKAEVLHSLVKLNTKEK